MACQNNGGAAVDRKPAHQGDKLPRLRAIVFIASEYVGHGVDNENLGPDGRRLALDLLNSGVGRI